MSEGTEVIDVTPSSTTCSGGGGISIVNPVLSRAMVLVDRRMPLPDPETLASAHEVGVAMEQKAYAKMFGYVAKTDIEVSGLGRVERRGNLFVIKDVFVLDQKNGPARTTIDEEAYSKLARKLHKRGLDTCDLRNWWHSHVDMDVSPSGLDLQTIEGLADSAPQVSIIVNKALRVYCRVDFWSPVRMAVVGIPLRVVPALTPAMVAEIEADIERLRPRRKRRA